MNRMKFYLMRAFAFVLLFSLLVFPAAASQEAPFDFVTYDRLQQRTERFLTATYSETDFTPNATLIRPVTVKTLLVSDVLFARIAAPDQVYELINTGNEDITISVVRYVQKSASVIREEYARSDVSCMNVDELPEDETPIWFAIHTVDQRYFLTDGGNFARGYSSEDDMEIKKIRPGETVTFVLPDARCGELYRVFIDKEGSFLRPYYIFIGDTKAIPGGVTLFGDVPDSKYYSVPVEWAVHRKITTGTTETTFSPDETCTTAQILTFLWRANGQPASAIENPFVDVSEENYYYQAALWAAENGLAEGEVFDGSAPCTRAMTVTYLWKLAGKQSAEPCDFKDVDAAAEYAQAVAWAVSEGITNGTSETTFSPDATCTRAQIVTLLYRALAD